MKQRCNNENHSAAAYYSSKGISYDPCWERFSGFYADMGNCPEGKELDRIDNKLGYFKDNCRWVDGFKQAQNRSNVKLTVERVKLLRGLIRSVKPRSSANAAYKVFAELFEVSLQAVWSVATGRAWRNVA